MIKNILRKKMDDRRLGYHDDDGKGAHKEIEDGEGTQTQRTQSRILFTVTHFKIE